MGPTALGDEAQLSEVELARLARVLARFLSGRQPSAAGTQAMGRLAGQGHDFLDFRQYQSGDDFRSIDWRASARSNAVQVRRYSGDVSCDWYLCVDTSASMGVQGGANWLLAKKLSAALAYVFLYLGHRVGLLLFNSDIDTACTLGRGHGQYARIQRALNTHSPQLGSGRSDPGVCSSLVGQRHPLIIVSDFLAEDAMVPALAKLLTAQRQLHLFQLNAAEHSLLPDAGNLLLEDIENGQLEMCGDSNAAQARARLRLAALEDELNRWCLRYRVPLTRCSADDNWRDMLLRHFTQG